MRSCRDLASLVYKDIVRESVVQEASDVDNIPLLIADLIISAWKSQTHMYIV